MATTSMQGLPPRHDGFHLDPPLYYPPTLQSQGSPFEKTNPSFPFYQPPPKSKLPQTTEEAKANFSQTAERTVEQPLEHTTGQEHATSQKAESHIDMSVELSERIHVVGFTQHAKLMIHALAAVPNLPPPAVLAHHPSVMTRWGEEGRNISVFDTLGQHVSSRDVLCPEYIGFHGRGRRRHYPLGNQEVDYLDNIIVDTASWAVLPSLRGLRHRIDQRTTICLQHPGLGVMEILNEKVFDDPTLRPNFVLGHTTHKVLNHSKRTYSLRHAIPGKLMLHGVDKIKESKSGMSEPSYLAMRYTQHFINLMSTTDSLGTVALPWDLFLANKLPLMVFSSLADTISVILGCRFYQIRRDEHAMCLWESLLDETVAIISAFPEFKRRPDLLDHFTRESFSKKLYHHLGKQSDNYSHWITWIRHGVIPPIDFLNGYFIKRAKELGVDHRQHSMAMSMVKARQKARRQELLNDIPLGMSPYMMDGDMIGGGQGEDDESGLDLELEI
ncbi:Uu.00g119130.m01.CDS01 [Anthostomella pinea]|uniref:Uu.00g119130.m01.CDS01 n=1 Tax=Anthostomella pinea TaxID=933095 RepID=A0AAI8VGH3_9PEZI|nr:Uu.00g119130.m01.CDS01 [Anthostomella pinea]